MAPSSKSAPVIVTASNGKSVVDRCAPIAACLQMVHPGQTVLPVHQVQVNVNHQNVACPRSAEQSYVVGGLTHNMMAVPMQPSPKAMPPAAVWVQQSAQVVNQSPPQPYEVAPQPYQFGATQPYQFGATQPQTMFAASQPSYPMVLSEMYASVNVKSISCQYAERKYDFLLEPRPRQAPIEARHITNCLRSFKAEKLDSIDTINGGREATTSHIGPVAALISEYYPQLHKKFKAYIRTRKNVKTATDLMSKIESHRHRVIGALKKIFPKATPEMIQRAFTNYLARQRESQDLNELVFSLSGVTMSRLRSDYRSLVKIWDRDMSRNSPMQRLAGYFVSTGAASYGATTIPKYSPVILVNAEKKNQVKMSIGHTGDMQGTEVVLEANKLVEFPWFLEEPTTSLVLNSGSETLIKDGAVPLTFSALNSRLQRCLAPDTSCFSTVGGSFATHWNAAKQDIDVFRGALGHYKDQTKVDFVNEIKGCVVSVKMALPGDAGTGVVTILFASPEIAQSFAEGSNPNDGLDNASAEAYCE